MKDLSLRAHAAGATSTLRAQNRDAPYAFLREVALWPDGYVLGVVQVVQWEHGLQIWACILEASWARLSCSLLASWRVRVEMLTFLHWKPLCLLLVYSLELLRKVTNGTKNNNVLCYEMCRGQGKEKETTCIVNLLGRTKCIHGSRLINCNAFCRNVTTARK